MTSSIIWGKRGEHLKHLKNIRATIFSDKALGRIRSLYIMTLVAWAGLVIWWVASGSRLETPDASSTLVKIGLLEAFAFLVAWSFLVITITIRIVNKGRDIEFATKEAQAEFKRHEENHPDFRAEVEELQALLSSTVDRISRIDERAEQLKKENDRLTKENDQLHRLLDDRAADP